MIKVISVGKIKEKFFKEAVDEYLKRMSKYTKIEIIEVADYSGDNIDIVLSKEKEQIEKHMGKKDFLITLEIEGQSMDSLNFAHTIDDIIAKHPNITFVIGGSYGIHQDIKKNSNLKLSFSKLTFPHQLFRVILLEQIYRAFKILNNETYHK